MRDTKRKQMFVQMYDHTGTVRRLEEMALRGWKLEKIGNLTGWKFRRIEPQPLRYSVAYFPDASEYDAVPSDRQLEFIELCAESGWEYIDHLAQMLVFCSADPNALPIETDAEMQVETVHKAMKKNFLPSQYALLILSVLQLWMWGARVLNEPVYALSQNALLVAAIAYFMLVVMCVRHIGGYYLWRRKAIKAAQDGVFVETKRTDLFGKVCLVVILTVLAVWLFSMRSDYGSMRVVGYTFAVIFGIVCLASGTKYVMQKLHVERETNRVATILITVIGTIAAIVLTGGILSSAGEDPVRRQQAVGSYFYHGTERFVYDDAIPLRLKDLGIAADYENKSCEEEVQASVLLTVYNGRETAPAGLEEPVPELFYTLTIPRYPWVKEVCRNRILWVHETRAKYGEILPTDPTVWQAKRVDCYRYGALNDRHYFVEWEDRYLELSVPADMTEDQIRLVTECLRTFEP